MHRLTARFLLLFALVGSFLPLALASITPPAHACCRRKSAHPCHASAVDEGQQLSIRATSCCTPDGARAVTISQWANLQPPALREFTPDLRTRIVDSSSIFLSANTLRHPSSRAPPTLSLA